MMKDQQKDYVKHQHSNMSLAIILMVFAAFSYAMASIFVKFAAQSAPLNAILFFRYVFFLIILVAIGAFQPQHFKTHNLVKHCIRGVCGALSIACFYFAVIHAPLTEAVLLSVSTPIFIPLVLRVTRKVKIVPQLYWGIVIGLCGVALILHPHGQGMRAALLIAVASAILRAFSSSFIRHLSRSDSTITILFYYFLLGSVLSGFSLFFNIHQLKHLPWLLLLMIGFLSACYQLCLTTAYRLASTRLVSPLTYLTVVFAAIFDWLIWQQTVAITTIIGIVIVFVGATLTIVLGSKQMHPS